MAGRDVERSYNIKRLFDKQLDKVDNKLDHPERQAAAATLMDKLVGPEWRGELQLPGIEIIEVQTVGASNKTATDPQSFYDRVHKCMSDEGLNFKDEGGLDEAESKDIRQVSDKDPKANEFMSELKKLVDKFL